MQITWTEDTLFLLEMVVKYRADNDDGSQSNGCLMSTYPR